MSNIITENSRKKKKFNKSSKRHFEFIRKYSILIPGGAVHYEKDQCQEHLRNDVVQSSRYIYEIAQKLAEEDHNYFPLWGTCLGYQLLLIHSANEGDIRISCQRMNCCLPQQLASMEGIKYSSILSYFI